MLCFNSDKNTFTCICISVYHIKTANLDECTPSMQSIIHVGIQLLSNLLTKVAPMQDFADIPTTDIVWPIKDNSDN